MPWSWAYSTDAGRRAKSQEKKNQDRVHTFEKDNVLYQIVADGNGETDELSPAAFVVNEIERFIDTYSDEGMSLPEIKRMILGAIYCANRVLLAYKRSENGKYADSFCTICVTAIMPDNALVFAWSGDSRIYLIRKEMILCITKDHTEAQRLCDEGKISKDEIFSHPERDILTSALGYDNPRIDILDANLTDGDILILMTDGIYKMLTQEQMVQIIQDAGNCEDACNALIEGANIQGGVDNMAVAMTYVNS